VPLMSFPRKRESRSGSDSRDLAPSAKNARVMRPIRVEPSEWTHDNSNRAWIPAFAE